MCKWQNYYATVLQVRLKNWKDEKEKESGNFLSISELLSQSKLHGVGVYASISKMVLTGSLASHFNRKFSVIERFSLKEHDDIFRDLVTAGCMLCGSPLYPKYAPYMLYCQWFMSYI